MTCWIKLDGSIVVAIDTVAPFPDSIEVENVPVVAAGEYLEYSEGEFVVKQYPPFVPPPEPVDEFAELKQQLAQKTVELSTLRDEMADQTTAILEIYDILGGM